MVQTEVYTALTTVNGDGIATSTAPSTAVVADCSAAEASVGAGQKATCTVAIGTAAAKTIRIDASSLKTDGTALGPASLDKSGNPQSASAGQAKVAEAIPVQLDVQCLNVTAA